MTTSFSYDNANRLTTLTHQVAGGSALATYVYGYDGANRVTSETNAEGSVTYAYDSTNQLTTVSGARSESYSYDLNGNRTMTGYTTGAGNQLAAGAGYTFTYDSEGNLTSKTETATGEVTTYSYDHRNRLTQVGRRSSGSVLLAESSYVYDALSRRIRVTSDADGAGAGAAVTTWTVYDGDNPYADFNGSGSLNERYLYALMVDSLLARTDSPNDTDWYLTDRLGSVRSVADAATGAAEYSASYDSYGKVIASSGTADRFGFTSREWDDVAKSQYNRARYYDSSAGRWFSEDPIGFYSRDFNLYRYMSNNLSCYVDPSGLQEDPLIAINPISIAPPTFNTPSRLDTILFPAFPASLNPSQVIAPTGEALRNPEVFPEISEASKKLMELSAKDLRERGIGVYMNGTGDIKLGKPEPSGKPPRPTIQFKNIIGGPTIINLNPLGSPPKGWMLIATIHTHPPNVLPSPKNSPLDPKNSNKPVGKSPLVPWLVIDASGHIHLIGPGERGGKPNYETR